jgi:hypothetical protein
MRPKYKAIILSFILIFLIFSPTNPETPISPVLQIHDANYEENLNENLNKIIIEVNGSQLKPLLNVYTMIPRLAVYNGSQWIELKLELVPYEFREEYAFGVEKQIVPSFDTFETPYSIVAMLYASIWQPLIYALFIVAEKGGMED